MKNLLLKCLILTSLLVFTFSFTKTRRSILFSTVNASNLQKDARGNPINWCREGFFLDDIDSISIGSVVGRLDERAYFFSDDDDCPKLNDPKCQKKSYLITGDKVFVCKTYKAWSCAWYQPKKGNSTVNWLQTEKLKMEEIDKKPALEKWVGTWSYYDNSIEITKDNKGSLIVKGDAIYKGLTSPHIGEIEPTTVKPVGNKLTIGDEADEYSCKVSFILASDFLIVNDNSNCGGANVTFDGIYFKKISSRR